MVIRKSKQRYEERQKVQNGQGTVTFVHHAPAETFHHEKMYAEVSLQPGDSIGLHEHHGETEFYLIRSGQGLVVDNGSEVIVRRGDCVITGHGSSHSIKNIGKTPLVFDALIVSY